MADLKTILDFMLDYGGSGSLPNMDTPDGEYEGGSGHHAYEAALRLQKHGLTKAVDPMTKQEVFEKLTELYNICHDSSSNKDKFSDDGWMNMAGAISTAEDVATREIMWEKNNAKV
mgnify:CR=1 FL=1